MPDALSLSRPRWLSRLLLMLLVPAAYLTQLQTYIRVADDYPFATRWETGLMESVRHDWSLMGLRRSVGKIANIPLCGSPVEITGWLCVGLHLATVLLFHAVAARLLRSNYAATILAIMLGVFPGVYMAVTWACGTYVITMSLFFLAGLWVLLRVAEKPEAKPWPMAGLAFLLIFLSCLFGEQLIFASVLTGLLAWTTAPRSVSDERPWRQACSKPWVWAPAAAVAVYLALAVLTQPARPVMIDLPAQFDPLKFNPRTLVSVWFHQLRNFDMLQPWAEPGAWSVAFASWSPARWLCAAVLGLGAWWSGRKFLGCEDRVAAAPVPTSRVSLVLGAMMLGVSFVHALAGGYSGSSRHSYAPLLLGLLFTATILRRWAARVKIPAFPRGALLAPVAVGCVVTAWLVTGVNRFELKRHDALLDFLAAHPPPMPVRIEYAPPLYAYWPRMERLANPLDAAWVIGCGLRYRGVPDTVEISRSAENAMIVERAGPLLAFQVRQDAPR